MRRQSSTSAMLRESAASVGQGKREPHRRRRVELGPSVSYLGGMNDEEGKNPKHEQRARKFPTATPRRAEPAVA